MAERPDQIEQHIKSTRSELGNNLQELEYKVKQATDWRTYFERNPMTLMGVAFGGGVLLASMVGSKNSIAPTIEQERQPSRNFADHTRRKSDFRQLGYLKERAGRIYRTQGAQCVE